MTPLLEVRGLQVYFDDARGRVQAVRGIGLRLQHGETLGIVGETGSGKSVTAAALMGLLSMPPAIVQAEHFHFNGQSLLDGSRLHLRAVERLRGRGMAMVFQDPSSALNPVFPIGDMLSAVLRQHAKLCGDALRARAVELLAQVGLPEAERVLRQYPHQMSGGMKQRAAIAMALAAEPALFIADEPTTALDATVQAQVLTLLRRLQKDTGVAMIFISHDLSVVARVCARVAVMYAGRIVEEAPVARLFAAPAHPYTRGLMAARPVLHLADVEHAHHFQAAVMPRKRERLTAIPGSVPTPSQVPAGCAFHPRCASASARCALDVPPLAPLGTESHRVSCFHPVTDADDTWSSST